MAKFYLALITLAIAALIATLVYAAFSDYRPFAARAHDPPTQGRETRLFDGGSALTERLSMDAAVYLRFR